MDKKHSQHQTHTDRHSVTHPADKSTEQVKPRSAENGKRPDSTAEHSKDQRLMRKGLLFAKCGPDMPGRTQIKI
jgi:hypothetical protein